MVVAIAVPGIEKHIRTNTNLRERREHVYKIGGLSAKVFGRMRDCAPSLESLGQLPITLRVGYTALVVTVALVPAVKHFEDSQTISRVPAPSPVQNAVFEHQSERWCAETAKFSGTRLAVGSAAASAVERDFISHCNLPIRHNGIRYILKFDILGLAKPPATTDY